MNRLAEALLHVTSHQARSVEPKREPVAIVPEKPTVAKPRPIEPDRVVRPLKPLPAFRFPPLKTANRRRGYRDLARLRRVRESLKLLASTIGNPSNKLHSPGDIYHYLEGMEQLEKAFTRYRPANWSLGKLDALHRVSGQATTAFEHHTHLGHRATSASHCGVGTGHANARSILSRLSD